MGGADAGTGRISASEYHSDLFHLRSRAFYHRLCRRARKRTREPTALVQRVALSCRVRHHARHQRVDRNVLADRRSNSDRGARAAMGGNGKGRLESVIVRLFVFLRHAFARATSRQAQALARLVAGARRRHLLSRLDVHLPDHPPRRRFAVTDRIERSVDELFSRRACRALFGGGDAGATPRVSARRDAPVRAGPGGRGARARVVRFARSDD